MIWDAGSYEGAIYGNIFSHQYCFRRRCMKRILLSFFVLMMACLPAHAEVDMVDKDEPSPKRLLVLPYPFYNDTIGTGIGAAAIAEGYGQEQMFTVGSALFSLEGTYAGFLMIRNYQFPWLKRIFLEPAASYGKFKEIRSYTIGNPAFPNERPGSNESREDNFLESDGTDFWVDFSIKYLLPIGSGKDIVLPDVILENGIAIAGQPGGYHWNPLRSGRTFLELEPFFRDQDLDEKGISDQRTAGVEVALVYDNLDFFVNPSKGSYWRFFFDRDWGGFDSSAPWSVWGGEFNKYFSLGPSKTARQRVIALNFWTVVSPTWDSSHTENGREVFHRPPSYKGGNLGGLWRLRGYPATRYNDKAAIYYGLEYRHTLDWNPLKDITLGGRLDVDWIQLVALGEVGRVAPTWKLDTLHEDMRWSAGGGIRAMVNHLLLRLDVAKSEEDVIAQLFIGHPWPKR